MKTVIASIRYYNVWFYLYLRSEQDLLKYAYLEKRIKMGEAIQMKEIFGWCKAQGVHHKTKFQYRKDFSLKANIWNFYSYIRGKMENRKELSVK